MKGKLLSRVQLLATPWTAAYQAPPSMGFSRQEYWSGVPLPSPMEHLGGTNPASLSIYLYVHACAKLLKSCLTLCNARDCSPPGSSVHVIFQARILKWVAISSSRGSSQPRDRIYISCIGSRILYHLSHMGSYWLLLLLLSRFSRVRLCATP